MHRQASTSFSVEEPLLEAVTDDTEPLTPQAKVNLQRGMVRSSLLAQVCPAKVQVLPVHPVLTHCCWAQTTAAQLFKGHKAVLGNRPDVLYRHVSLLLLDVEQQLLLLDLNAYDNYTPAYTLTGAGGGAAAGDERPGARVQGAALSAYAAGVCGGLLPWRRVCPAARSPQHSSHRFSHTILANLDGRKWGAASPVWQVCRRSPGGAD